MLNEGTSIVASFSVGLRLMEGTHESPVWSLYGLKTLLCVTGVIAPCLVACQNMRYTCWNGDAKPFSFLKMLNVLLHVHKLKSWPSFERPIVVSHFIEERKHRASLESECPLSLLHWDNSEVLALFYIVVQENCVHTMLDFVKTPQYVTIVGCVCVCVVNVNVLFNF